MVNIKPRKKFQCSEGPVELRIERESPKGFDI
jgi:hypothetical protein